MRRVPEGGGIALPQAAYRRHAPRWWLWHARHRAAQPPLLPHDGVPQGLAATYTCSGITAFSALKKTRERLGAEDHLVIIGAGGVGGSAVHIAPAAVDGKIIVADIDAQKRAQARQMGAVATIDNAAADAVKQVMAATGGGAAAAIDFVGSPQTMEFGVNILRRAAP
jgi:D-arabinose 1-dehydrogenase-like Zn-dependent alcohol dehydrogenase